MEAQKMFVSQMNQNNAHDDLDDARQQQQLATSKLKTRGNASVNQLTPGANCNNYKLNTFNKQQQQQQQQSRASSERFKSTLNQLSLKVDNEFLARSLGKLVEATKSKCLGRPTSARLGNSNNNSKIKTNARLTAGSSSLAVPTAAVGAAATIATATGPGGGGGAKQFAWSVPTALRRSSSLNSSGGRKQLPIAGAVAAQKHFDRLASLKRNEFSSKSFNRDNRGKLIAADVGVGGGGGGGGSASFRRGIMSNLLLDKSAAQKKLLTFTSFDNNNSNSGSGCVGGKQATQFSKVSRPNASGSANKIVSLITASVPTKVTATRRQKRVIGNTGSGLRAVLPNKLRLPFVACVNLILLCCLSICCINCGSLTNAATLDQLQGVAFGRPRLWSIASDQTNSEAAREVLPLTDNNNDDETNSELSDIDLRKVDISNLLDQIQTRLELNELKRLSGSDWLAFSDGNEAGDDTAAAEAPGSYNNQELLQQQQQQPVKPNVLQPPSEYVWIERRRLNRDRALEPPAWLRDRPIRRDNSRQSEQQRRAEAEAGADAAGTVSAEAPIGQRSTRAVRQQRHLSGNKYYDELVRYLIAGALEGRSMLDDFNDNLELEARISGGGSSGSGNNNGAGAGTGGSGSREKLGASGGAGTDQQRAGRQEESGDRNDLKLLGQDLDTSDSEGNLVVAGDDISDNDDVTILELPQFEAPTVPIQQHQQDLQSSKLIKKPVPLQQQQQVQLQSGVGGGQLPRLALAADKTLALPVDPLGPSGLVPLLTSGGIDQSSSAGLGKLMQHHQAVPSQFSGDVNSGQPMFNSNNNNDEQSFHVIEDIDQVDSGIEIPLNQQQHRTAANLVERAIDELTASELSAAGGDSLLANSREKRSEPVASIGSSEVDPELLAALVDLALEHAERNKLFKAIQSTGSIVQSNDNQAEAGDSEKSAQNSVSPAESSYEPRRSPMERVASQQLTSALRAPREPLDHSGDQFGKSQQPVAETIDLIQSGHFARSQLIAFVTRVRAHLENKLGLRAGSILELYPEANGQLIIVLDLTKLSGFNVAHLSSNFGYVRGSSTLVLNSPPSSTQAGGVGGNSSTNLVTILRAVTNALLHDDQLDEDRMLLQDKETTEAEAAAAAAAAATGLQINEQQQQQQQQQQLQQLGHELAPVDEQQAASAGQSAYESPVGLNIPSVLAPLAWPPAAAPKSIVAVRRPRPQLSQAVGARPLGQHMEVGRQINWTPDKSMSAAGEFDLDLDLDLDFVPKSEFDASQQDDQFVLGPAPQVAGPNLNTWWTNQLDNGNTGQQRQLAQQQQPPQQQQPLSVLAAYLSAIYNLDGSGGGGGGGGGNQIAQLAAWSPEQVEQLAWLGNNLRSRARQQQLQWRRKQLSAGSSINGTVAAPGGSLFDKIFANQTGSHWSTFFVLLALPFVSTYLIVKLIMRKLDKRIRSQFGAGAEDGTGGEQQQLAKTVKSAQTIKGETRGHDGSGKLLNSSSGLAGKLDKEQQHEQQQQKHYNMCSSKVLRKSMDLLAQSWTGLAKGGQSEKGQISIKEDGQLKRPCECNSALGSNEKLIEATAATAATAPTDDSTANGNQEATHFRTSTSYIRSLIEALTKAATNQMSTQTPPSSRNLHGGSQSDDDDDGEDDDDDANADASKAAELINTMGGGGGCSELVQHKQLFCSANNNNNNNNSNDDGEILMSQMDISAAHLILNYMEKHLIDKERLRREWLELNASLGLPVAPPPQTADGSAAQQKLTTKSAAPAAHAATRAKADLLLLQRLAKVALSDDNLDKNRDHLVVPFDRNRVKLGGASRNQRIKSIGSNNNSNNNNNSGSRAQAGSDYINASYIYDDDPRRPTHIIAQGPMEQTCGQFWQMIWEQEISIIVMLTRLNENGHQMCHCYWPLNVTPVAATSASVSNAPSDASSLHGLAPGPGGARRGSVTSVFSGSNGNHQQQHLVAPISISGAHSTSDNVLSFEVPLLGQRAPFGSQHKLSTSSGTSSSGSEASDTIDTKAVNCNANKTSGATIKLEVHLISEHVSSSDYLVRNMYLINGTTGETRTISQFHYLSWLNGRTPDNVRSFLQFRRKVHKSYRNLKSPILVHCNNGAGRSGTYTLIDMILERIKNGAKEIDLRASLEHLRDQRIGLCETQAQFEFVLVALAEEIQIILNALPQ